MHAVFTHGQFIASKDKVKKGAPFDLIVADCCFHHIDDITLHKELNEVKRILIMNGTLIMIDILFSKGDTQFLRKLFRKSELGAHVKLIEDYQERMEQHFEITRIDIVRPHLSLIKNNLIYNNSAFLECKGMRPS